MVWLLKTTGTFTIKLNAFDFMRLPSAYEGGRLSVEIWGNNIHGLMCLDA